MKRKASFLSASDAEASANQVERLQYERDVVAALPDEVSKERVAASKFEHDNSALGCLNYGELSSHLSSLKREHIMRYMRPVVNRLMQSPVNADLFNKPLDPVFLKLAGSDRGDKTPPQIDLGTIKSRLHSGMYESIASVESEILQVFKSALAFHPQKSTVAGAARALLKETKVEMEGVYDRVSKEISRKTQHECSLCVGATCVLCKEKCLKFEPPVMLCQGSCGQRIKRNSMYFISMDGSKHYCQKCHISLSSSAIIGYIDPTLARGSRSTSNNRTQGNKAISAVTSSSSSSSASSSSSSSTSNNSTGSGSTSRCGTSEDEVDHQDFVSAEGSVGSVTRSEVVKDEEDDALIPITKWDLMRRRTDEEVSEPWIECDSCGEWMHQICALFSSHELSNSEGSFSESTCLGDFSKIANSTTLTEQEGQFDCPNCKMEQADAKAAALAVAAKKSGGRKRAKPGSGGEKSRGGNPIKSSMRGGRSPGAAIPTNPKWLASSLPRTNVSDYLEHCLRHRVLTSGFSAEVAASLTVRLASNTEHSMKVVPEIHEVLSTPDGATIPASMPYRQKCLLLFQSIDGVDVCLFSLYVQEFGDDCPAPNHRRVYISYLDSVEFLRPIEARTMVYHEMMVGYLKWAQARGFSHAHLWSCPPNRGDNFIFWCHPAYQRTPTRERLNAWYNTMLTRAESLGVVSSRKSLRDSHFTQFFQLFESPYIDQDALLNAQNAAAMAAASAVGSHDARNLLCIVPPKPKRGRPSAQMVAMRAAFAAQLKAEKEAHAAMQAERKESKSGTGADGDGDTLSDRALLGAAAGSSAPPGSASAKAQVHAQAAAAAAAAASTAVAVAQAQTSSSSSRNRGSVNLLKKYERGEAGLRKLLSFCPPIFEGDFFVFEYLRLVKSVLSKAREYKGMDDSANTRKVKDIVRQLLARPDGSTFFGEPVNPEELDIPHYRDVITHPMDLGTVREKLVNGCYENMLEFAQDVRLTFDNAMEFNPPGHLVYESAKGLSRILEKALLDLVADRNGDAERGNEGKDKSKAVPTPSSTSTSCTAQSSGRFTFPSPTCQPQLTQQEQQLEHRNHYHNEPTDKKVKKEREKPSPRKRQPRRTRDRYPSRRQQQQDHNEGKQHLSSSAEDGDEQAQSAELNGPQSSASDTGLPSERDRDNSTLKRSLDAALASYPLMHVPGRTLESISQHASLLDLSGYQEPPTPTNMHSPRAKDILSKDRSSRSRSRSRTLNASASAGAITSISTSSTAPHTTAIAIATARATSTRVNAAGMEDGGHESHGLSSELSSDCEACSNSTASVLPEEEASHADHSHTHTHSRPRPLTSLRVGTFLPARATSCYPPRSELRIGTGRPTRSTHAEDTTSILTKMGPKGVQVLVTELVKQIDKFREDLFVIKFADLNDRPAPSPSLAPQEKGRGAQSKRESSSPMTSTSARPSSATVAAGAKPTTFLANGVSQTVGPPAEIFPGADAFVRECLPHLRAGQTCDPDTVFTCPLLQSRGIFLEMCQYSCMQFDSLRRAKHSSLKLLHHLSNPHDPATRPHCSHCHSIIRSGSVRWHCDLCSHFDLCVDCVKLDLSDQNGLVVGSGEDVDTDVEAPIDAGLPENASGNQELSHDLQHLQWVNQRGRPTKQLSSGYGANSGAVCDFKCPLFHDLTPFPVNFS
jgi:hypothetical protein